MHSGVIPAALRLVQQEALFSRFPWGKQRLASVALTISQGLREGLVACLRQQENANDANEGATGKNDVVKKVALLIVQFHDGCSEHTKASAG